MSEPKKIKVRMKRLFCSELGAFQVGQEVELDAELAEQFIADRAAEAIAPPEPKRNKDGSLAEVINVATGEKEKQVEGGKPVDNSKKQKAVKE